MLWNFSPWCVNNNCCDMKTFNICFCCCCILTGKWERTLHVTNTPYAVSCLLLHLTFKQLSQYFKPNSCFRGPKLKEYTSTLTIYQTMTNNGFKIYSYKVYGMTHVIWWKLPLIQNKSLWLLNDKNIQSI